MPQASAFLCHKVLDWAKKATDTLLGWLKVILNIQQPAVDEQQLLRQFTELPKEVRAALLLRLAVHTLGQINDTRLFDKQEKYIVMVQAAYLKLKQENGEA